jgi:DNA modification methylase
LTVRILQGDCRDVLREQPENHVHCFMTSIPYYGLRDYKIPPSIWGGDPKCEHDFQLEEVATEVGRGNWAQGTNGRGEEQPGGVDAAREPIRSTTERGFCRHCGAWRGVLGLEPGWRLYVEHVVEAFREVRRVLRKDGTLWLNVGDSYASATTRGNNGYGTSGLTNGGAYQDEVPRAVAAGLGARARRGANLAAWSAENARGGGHKAGQVNAGWEARPELGATSMKRTRATRDGTHAGKHESVAAFGPMSQPNRTPQDGFKPKDRMMIPARVAIALQDDGWWIRDEIVWRKPNPMPSSTTDRTTPAHEMIYMLTKSARYFYDAEAIAEPANYPPGSGYAEAAKGEIGGRRAEVADDKVLERPFRAIRETRNKRSVWDIPTSPFPEDHFATFPPDLVEPCVLAGTSARGCCPHCRAPWSRVTSEVDTGKTQKLPAGVAAGPGSHSVVDHNVEGRPVAPDGNAVTATVTLGWYPSCRCIGAPALLDYPQKPSRARSASKEAYTIAMKDWREHAAAIDDKRARMCEAMASTPTVPALVCDPFGGSGTVGLVADRLQRDALLIDLGKRYVDMARRRINDDAPLFGAAE